ncbi:CheR family methyltransferase [Tunturiibacter gelidoferens]|uniref:Chemotaxis protein methyltransferase CheR n=3 Tax=Tunturiibacter TaxID=3154218 RepID=A0A7Y9T5S4_9BACT|nr:protein-glutamate O-methyltransferase CheR [Edaphobacter lichenicola]MBB5338111.1 chemotaxis protein methyltransferase CheR [Edaphobacter lichenicola]NYF52634.1 chemotaxis protein methyltransferase CheR [Edaphobacter lichenicola]
MACSDTDYAYLRELVLEQSANLIDPSRNALFDTRLTPIARLSGADNLEDFVNMLKAGRPAHLHRAVAEAMTINETSFFRDMRPFEMLRQIVIPRLIERRAETRRLRIWSAASSTGQEAYSLAMMISEHFPELASWDLKIVGTDISRQVVDYAQKGRYRRLEVNRGLPARMLLKYMTRHGEEWEVSPQIRSMCEFHYANLCAPLPLLPTFDLVLLRNVLLYFSQQDRRALFGEIYRKLSPAGYLVLGNAEQAEDSTNLFEVEFGADCYFYSPVSAS